MPRDRGAVATITDGTRPADLVPGRPQLVIEPPPVSLITSSTTSPATNSATWDAWNQIYTITQRYTNVMATTENAYALQAELNALAATWTAWNVSYSTSATTTGNTWTVSTWDAWNETYVIEAQDRENQIRRDILAGKRPSAEQQERWRREELARKEAEAKRLREELTAKEKAIVLLKSCLSQEQKEEYEKKGCFHLHVGDKKYRIEQGSHGNVKLVDKDGKVRRSFCVQPRGVPDGDAMLAQKLLLETDEKRFYELANVSEYGDNGAVLRTLHAPRGADLLREVEQRTAG